MTTRKLTIISFLIMTGCSTPADERLKITNYKCKQEQIGLVDKQYEVCNKSGYMSAGCYLHSVISFCEYVGVK